jgi:hypothetical protein
MVTIPSDAFLMIIGAMKCGTTSLYDYLVQHPQICPCLIKEPEFFTEGWNPLPKPERYEDLWEFDPAQHRYVLEASMGYSKYPQQKNVPEKILAYGIQPKLIYIVRDPFDRVESQSNHEIRHSPDYDEEYSLADYPYTEVSKYCFQLSRYSSIFPRTDLLVLDFDLLVSDPVACLKKVYTFLGLAEHIPSSLEVSNQKRAISPIERVLGRYRFIRSFSKVVPRNLKFPISRLLVRIGGKVPFRTLSEAERGLIYERLKEDMHALRDEYGVDVGKWGF